MSAPGEHLLHFTLGPVQGFVAEARRLRDFWAGSFLLSWLSGQAMRAVIEAGGTIVFPQIEGDPLLEAIRTGGTGPHIGTLPNRFKARVPEDFDPQACAEAVNKAWQRLANEVWNSFVSDVESRGSGTREIWERQIGSFWEIAWVKGADPGDGTDAAWLDRRKNWRSHWPAGEERSDLCMMMGHLQEISGCQRFGGAAQQQAFWQALQEKVKVLNLREDERLSAVALVKRLFPLLKGEEMQRALGFRIAKNVCNWPSTAYLAAVPWLDRLTNTEFEDARKKYAQAASDRLKPGYKGETNTTVFGFPDKDFFKLDGQLYNEDGIVALPEEAFRGDAKKARADLQAALKNLLQKQAGAPSKFYALLLMDGDRIGALLRNDPELVKKGLAVFAAKVVDEFAQDNVHRGLLIYAGGDDVMAMLPVDTAISAAHELRAHYDAAFHEANAGADVPEATMSAAIVFAHYKTPLRHVIERAHHYLDEVAKEENGRDSLALAAMKPGGISCEWVSCWGDGENGPAQLLAKMARQMRRDPEFAGSFFHALRDRYGPLFDDGGGVEPAVGSKMMKALIRYEYLHSGKAKAENVDDAVRDLMTIGQPLERKSGNISQREDFSFDAGLMVRFLSRAGLWEQEAQDG